MTANKPHAPTHIGDRTFSYDANGNQTGWSHDQNGTRRNIVWDEENRIQSIYDNGQEKTYKYNDTGERVIKRGPQGETVYVNQYFVIRNKEIGDKHIFAGTTRVVSKLMKQDKPGANPQGQTPLEKDLYFYHPDHLGPSNYITDTNGKLYEHLEYFPFGETWVEESSNNTQRTPYIFTGKELDSETGLYYFGARYYDPRTSVWQSGDPVVEKYLPDTGKKIEFNLPELSNNWKVAINLPGLGGIYVGANVNLYAYSHQNPVVYFDPDGKKLEFAPGSTAEFKKQFAEIIQYLNKGGVAGVIAKLEARPEVYVIEQAKSRHEFSHDPVNKKIVFDTKSGLKVGTGKVQTPALGFLHEAAHA